MSPAGSFTYEQQVNMSGTVDGIRCLSGETGFAIMALKVNESVKGIYRGPKCRVRIVGNRQRVGVGR